MFHHPPSPARARSARAQKIAEPSASRQSNAMCKEALVLSTGPPNSPRHRKTGFFRGHLGTKRCPSRIRIGVWVKIFPAGQWHNPREPSRPSQSTNLLFEAEPPRYCQRSFSIPSVVPYSVKIPWPKPGSIRLICDKSPLKRGKNDKNFERFVP